MTENKQRVEVGDLFRDNDPRVSAAGARVIRLVSEQTRWGGRGFVVENVEHWDEKLIGRKSWVSRERLENGKNRQTGYTKVSR